MRRSWQLAGMWDTLRRNWRVRPPTGAREDLVPQLFLRELEQRRVLSVGVAVALAPVVVKSGMTEGAALSAEPAQLAHADSHATPDQSESTDPTTIAPQTPRPTDSQAGGPQANDPTKVEPITGANIQPQTAVEKAPLASVEGQDVSPSLTVAPDQSTNEGAVLAITDIGQFTEAGASDGVTFTYNIDWGDGRPVDSGTATIDVPGGPEVPTAGSFDGSHIYADNGVYTVLVTVTDSNGGSASSSLLVTVDNVSPSLTVAPDQTTNEGSLLAITNIGQFTDPGFDNPLNVGGETSETFTFAINWGDGTPVDSGPPVINVPGGPGVLTAGSFDGSHIYADNGVYTVTVTVADDDGGLSVGTLQVTVDNVAPSLTVAPDQTSNEGSLLAITNIGQFADPGFDNPLNIGGETSETFTFAINWGDGTPVDSGPPTIDVPGSPGVLTAGSFDGAHIYADNGVYTVTVTVADDDGGLSVGTLQVTVDNVAPTLTVVPDQTVNEGSLLAITNIGQFTDPGFDNPLNVGGETSETFTFAINWGDGTPIDSGPPTIDVPGGPGVLTAGSFDGSHIYADNGVYTVTVTVADDDGGLSVGTLQVTVNNVAPTLTVAPDQTVNEGSLLSITDIGKFTDPGFDNPANVPSPTTETFTFSIDWGDGLPASSGVATIDSPGGPGVLTAGSFDSSHIYADNGVYKVAVTVTDDDGGSSVATFQVTVNNVAPSLTVAGDQKVSEGGTLTITPIGQFTDPGFDNPLNVGGETTERFTFAINWGDGSPVDSGPGAITTPGGPGVLTAGSFTGQHIYANGGVYTVTVTISDDDGGSATGTLTVYVGPTLIAGPNQTIDEGSLLSITGVGKFTDPTPANLTPGSDAAGGPFTFAINWGDGTPVNGGTATIDVVGSQGVPTAGSFDGTHTYADNGIYTVAVTVTALDGRSDTSTLRVTVNNVAPTLNVVGHQQVAQTTPLVINDLGKFTDPGFDNPLNVGGQTTERFTFTINWGDGTGVNSGPGNITTPGHAGVLTAGAFNGSHVYLASGDFTVKVTLSDDDGGTATQTFTVTVAVISPEKALRPPPGGGGIPPLPRPPDVFATAPQVQTYVPARTDVQSYRFGTVEGAEPRLVLRVVLPSGQEDKEHDETLPTEVLDDLRKLFKRLPDGNYRIYQIQPDGVERLVVDVIVRQGRSIDAADEADGAADLLPQRATPPASQPAPPDAGAEQSPRQIDQVEMTRHEGAQRFDPADERWSEAALLLGGYVATSAPARRAAKMVRAERASAERPLNKVRRLLRGSRWN